MKSKNSFDHTIKRVKQLIDLYKLLHDKRSRAIRTDWAKKFKNLMRWPSTETIQRIDGEGSILIIRQSSKLDRSHFSKDELSEILRAALVLAVSALDRYCHDMLIPKAMKMLKRKAEVWTKDFQKIALPLEDIKSAIMQAKKRMGRGGHIRTRPMIIVRAALQDCFHRNLTLQRPGDIAQAFSMVGIKSLWTECSRRMGIEPKEIERNLNRIITRRNQIVHEGDISRKQKPTTIKLNLVTENSIKKDIDWLCSLVDAIDKSSA
jgi:hypothetical protein